MLRLLAILLHVMPMVCAQPAPTITPEEVREKDRKKSLVRMLQEQSKRIGDHVARMRGLEFKEPVKKGIQSRDELRIYLQELMKRKQPKERMDAIARAYSIIGLMPKGIDLSKVVLDMLQSQVAGFYDPDAKALFLINEWSMSQSSVISHELMHALQDQHFDLLSLPMEDEKREDVVNAVRCIVEGEGMLVMFLYVGDEKAEVGAFESLLGQGYKNYIKALDSGLKMDLSTTDNPLSSMLGLDGGMSKVPRVLRESLVLPYIAGLGFVHRAWRKGGWQGVNDLYQDMPQSTEQVLHPDKYFTARDVPTIVEIAKPDLLAPKGYKLIYQSILGELYVSVLMRDFLGERTPKRAWLGWDGDLFLAFHEPGQDKSFCLWSTVWDSNRDAQEFKEYYERVEAIRAKEESGERFEIQISGNEVWIARGDLSQTELKTSLEKLKEARRLSQAKPIKSARKVPVD